MLGNIRVLSVLTFAGGMALATTVLPGGNVTPDTFNATQDITLLAHNTGTWTTPGSGGQAAAHGAFADAVYRTTVPGELDFVYQFENSSLSHNSITQTTGLSFEGFSPLDVGSMPNGSALPGGIFINGSTIPGMVSLDAGGSTVTFDFALRPITPGVTSEVLVIRAPATSFTSGVAGIIAGGTTNVPGFQPVPEPAMFLPLGMGLLAAIAIGRRKFAQHP